MGKMEPSAGLPQRPGSSARQGDTVVHAASSGRWALTMKIGPGSWRLRSGWVFLSLLCLGQAPSIYGDGNPACPHCQNSSVQAVPQLAAPPVTPAAPEPAVPIVKLRVHAPTCAVVGQEM